MVLVLVIEFGETKDNVFGVDADSAVGMSKEAGVEADVHNYKITDILGGSLRFF